MQADKLPALPTHGIDTANHASVRIRGYTAEQMHAYALLAIAEAAEDLRADAMRSIGELIRTQDNRITDSPIFIVQQKRRVWGIADDHTETFAWVDDDASEHYDDAEKAVRDAERAEDGSSPIEWRQVGYIDIWEFVTACFTEQGVQGLHRPRRPQPETAAHLRSRKLPEQRVASRPRRIDRKRRPIHRGAREGGVDGTC